MIGGGEALGRAVALALSARGVSVLVTGRDEKALGETVGEVVHGGGKARHLAASKADASHLMAAFDRALEVFGHVDIVVDADGVDVEYILSELAARMAGPGRLFVVGPVAGAPGVGLLVRSALDEVTARGITCNAIVADAAVADAPESAAELLVFLCTPAGDGMTGQTIAVGPSVRR